MTDDLRERLQGLAGDMPPLHAPADLDGRVRRREVGSVVGASVAVAIVVLTAVVGLRAFDRSAENPVKPATFPFPVAQAPVPASQALLQAPEGLMVDASGNLFISEWYGNRVDVLAPDGSLAVVAGTGVPGYEDDEGQATGASIDSPTAMVLDTDGALLFVDNGNNCIRKIDRAGTITTVAGMCGSAGYSGDGGPALSAQMSRPIGLVLDPEGGFYFSDNDFGLVRHVDAAAQMSTIAGAGNVSPLDAGPDGVPAASLDLGRTSYLVLDPDGNLYVTDLRLNIVVKIDPSGNGTVFAGTGSAGYTGDGGLATGAKLNFPAGLAMDPRGNLYVADSANAVIRMIRADGIIRTVAGTGAPGNSGDGGRATDAQLLAPSGLAFADGMLYISDQQNDAVRRVDASGVINTIAR